MATERELVEAIKEGIRGEEALIAWHKRMNEGDKGATTLKEVCDILREKLCLSCFHGGLIIAFSTMLGYKVEEWQKIMDTIYEKPWFYDKDGVDNFGRCEIH